MCKLYFHIPFNVNINNLNCSEEDKNLWCSMVRDHLLENFSYLEFVHSPTQIFECVVDVRDVLTTGIIIFVSTDEEDILATGVSTVNSEEICSIDETTMSLILGKIEKYIPEINELLHEKRHYYTILPTTARFTILIVPYTQIKVDERDWKPTGDPFKIGTVDLKLIQCVPKVELYKGETHNV